MKVMHGLLRLFSFLILLSLLAGCGYHVPGTGDSWAGSPARRVYVALFDNQTSQPYLDNYLTDALLAELARSRVLELTEDAASAELQLQGEVTNFESVAHAFSATDRIAEYRALMSVQVRLIDPQDTTVRWQQGFRRSQDYYASVDKTRQLDNERLAAQEMAARLAEDIHSHLLLGP